MRGQLGQLVPIALLAVTLVAAGTGLAASGAVDGRLQASEGVLVDGSTNASATSGTLNVLSPSIEEARLEAERATVRIGWDEGTLVQDSDGKPTSFYTQDRGVDWYNFTTLDGTLALGERTPQVLAFGGSHQTELHEDSVGHVPVAAVEDRSLAKHWRNGSTASSSRVIGFYHTLEEPRVALTGADRATVRGNFTLFVNNVTIQVTDSDRGDWSNWTGYRKSSPDSPAGPVSNPAAKEYEVRSTTIRVTNGTLWVTATDAVDLYARDASAAVNGSIRAPSVSGELLSDPLRYDFDDDPLRMWGRGVLDLGLASDGRQGEAARAPDSGTAVPPLALQPSGSFDVQPVDGVEVREAGTGRAWSPVSWLDGGTWTALAVLGAALAGASVGAVVPERVHGVIGAAFEGWREHQYKRWAREAELAIEDGALGRAETLASRATSLRPEAPDGWTSLAMARFGSEEPDRALSTFQEAKQALDTVPLLMLKLWVAYAQDLGEPEQAVEAWLTMADEHPEYALMMYVEEDYDALEDERVQARLAELEDEMVSENPELAVMLRDRGLLSGADDEGGGGHGPEVA